MTLDFSTHSGARTETWQRREALKLVQLIAKEGLCAMEVVEVSPPYDVSDTTSLMALRVIVDTLATLVANGKLPRHRG